MGLIPTLRSLRGAATCPDCGATRERETTRDPQTLLMVEAWVCEDCDSAEVIDADAGERAEFQRESEWRPLR